MAKFKLQYTLKHHRGTFVTAPRATEPNDEIRELQQIHRIKLKTLVVLRDSEGEDHPANAGKFFLHRIVR